MNGPIGAVGDAADGIFNPLLDDTFDPPMNTAADASGNSHTCAAGPVGTRPAGADAMTDAVDVIANCFDPTATAAYSTLDTAKLSVYAELSPAA